LGPLLAVADPRLASGWYSGLLADRSVEAELEAVGGHAPPLPELGAKGVGYGRWGELPGGTPLGGAILLSPPVSPFLIHI
ncbi:myo-inosose-2 dehydratase, partial [Klebsiella pneumoniae]|nr:myo-inosose-2 dehydratase [Klebsiella pneumoniae]